jgi:hypothetical protein
VLSHSLLWGGKPHAPLPYWGGVGGGVLVFSFLHSMKRNRLMTRFHYNFKSLFYDLSKNPSLYPSSCGEGISEVTPLPSWGGAGGGVSCFIPPILQTVSERGFLLQHHNLLSITHIPIINPKKIGSRSEVTGIIINIMHSCFHWLILNYCFYDSAGEVQQ